LLAAVSEDPVAARYPTTRWSRVIRAGDSADPSARPALEELCRDYWFPLYAFVRRHGLSRHEAEDIVQGLLADLIERGDMASMDQSKGRFRSFLRAACEHYLANRRDHDWAAKRGGGVTIVSVNRLDAEGRYGREPAHELTAERLFERQ
jgi:DNA-directed RNA polymerase specialized sigma24 family protein